MPRLRRRSGLTRSHVAFCVIAIFVLRYFLSILSTDGGEYEGWDGDAAGKSSAGLTILGFGFAGRDGGAAKCALQSQLANLVFSKGTQYFGAFKAGDEGGAWFDSFRVLEAVTKDRDDGRTESNVLDGVEWDVDASSRTRFDGTSLRANVEYTNFPIYGIDHAVCSHQSVCGTPKSLQRLGLRLNEIMRLAAEMLKGPRQHEGYVLAFDTSVYFPEPVVTREDAVAVIEKGEIRYLQVVSGGGVVLGRTQDVIDLLEDRISLPKVDGITSFRKPRVDDGVVGKVRTRSLPILHFNAPLTALAFTEEQARGEKEDKEEEGYI